MFAADAQPPFNDIDPSKIGPINGWKDTYGKRGTRRAYLIEFLRLNAARWMTTGMINEELKNRFGVVVQTPKEKLRWRSSFKASLKLLRQEGLVESLPAELRGGSKLGVLVMVRWRWKDDQPTTLAELREEEEQHCA